MRNVLIFACLILLPATSLMAAMPPDKTRVSVRQEASRDLDTWIDANKILMFVTNEGSFAYDQGVTLGKSDGLYYPFVGMDKNGVPEDRKTVIFASGIWVGAVDNGTGDTLISVAEYSDDFFPGPMVGGTFVANADTDPGYRVFKLYSDSLEDNANSDYTNWPVSQGAPVDSNGNPAMLGDQMLWAVYNDANPASHTNDASSPAGLGVEIKQTTFAFSREGALSNIVFVKFQIFNKGGKDLSNMFISLWADPDLGNAGDDFVGCDTSLSLGYCYNDGDDSDYGSTPPAVGYDFFQGPLFFTGDNADTAIMWDTTWVGYQNMAMTSFNKYINGTDPGSSTETYWYMNGLSDQVFGTPMVDPNTGDTTTFYGAGDPVKGTGWMDVNSSDRRYMLSVGPFDFGPGDSTEIVAAIIVGQGADELRSITVLKTIDAFAQRVYDRGFQLPDPPAKPDITAVPFDEEIVLRWGTASEDDPGDFPFEGYALFQGPSSAGPWIDTLGWFDMVNDIGGIIDYRFDLVTGQELPYVAKPGNNGGIEHFFRTSRNALTGGSLVNNTKYFFRCEAYSYDPLQPSGEKTLTSASIVSVIPTLPLVGTTLEAEFAGDIPTVHSTGIGEGTVTVSVVDPKAVTGDAYSVTFGEDTVTTITAESEDFFTFDTLTDTCAAVWNADSSWIDITLCVDTTLDSTVIHPPETTVVIGIFWNLTNTTKDTVLFTRMFNQGKQGEENYPVFDGIQAIVKGPDPAFTSFQVVANGAGVLDPPEAGAFGFQEYPTPPGTNDDGNPSDNQQVGDGHWGLSTGGNGGSCAGGTRGSFDAFIARGTRDEGNFPVIASFDYEMRFTGDTNSSGVYDPGLGGGSYAIRAFEDDYVTWVPFELWRTGIGTPDDPSDDVRLVVLHLDITGDSIYSLENWGCADSATFGGDGEHSASGADNDPYTDWIYWYEPIDLSPGDAGYQAIGTEWVTNGDIGAGYALLGDEVIARTVLINWNGHLAASDIDTALGDTLTVPAVFNQDLPEPGTVFRIITSKPSSTADVFTFDTDGLAASIAASGNEALLDKIRAVPNPYYLFSNYDVSNVNRRLKFTNLPEKCTIRIFNLGGDLVQKIEKNDLTTETFWDIENSSGVPVGSGIYIYVVEAPGFGQKIGKMAIFTEVELLNQY